MLTYYKFEIVTAHTLQMANMRHHAKFVQIGQTVADGIFRFFKMAIVRHLGFVIRLF